MTRALGLELRDTALAAVAIDDAGKVVARTVVDAADHVGESAVQAVLDRMPGRAITAAGVRSSR